MLLVVTDEFVVSPHQLNHLRSTGLLRGGLIRVVSMLQQKDHELVSPTYVRSQEDTVGVVIKYKLQLPITVIIFVKNI